MFIEMNNYQQKILIVAGCWLLVAGRLLLVACCWLLVACCWLLVETYSPNLTFVF